MDRIKMEPHSEVGAIPITFPAETKPMHIKAEAHLQITFPSIEPEVTEHNAIKMECDETTEVIEGDEVGKRKKEVKPVSITFPLIKKEIEHESFHSTVLEEQSTQAIVKEEHDINIQCGTEFIVLDDSPIEESDESDEQRNNVYSFDTFPKKSSPNCSNRKIFDEFDTDCKPLPCSKSFTTPEQLPNQVCANIQVKHNVVNKNKKLLHKRKNVKRQDHSKKKKRRFFCEICDKQFSTSSNLARHCQDIHLKLKPFRCPECDLHFNRNDQLTHHRQIHRQQRPRPFQCEECNKTYFSNKSLIRHQLIHKGQGLNNIIKEQKNAHFRCKICFKQFYDTRGLQSHLRTHTGDKPFKCDICSKQFAVKATLITHIYTHAAEKPFKCLHCNKQFVMKHRYTDHLNVHSQEKQYQCEICFKEYYLKRNFLIHKLTHNKKKSVK